MIFKIECSSHTDQSSRVPFKNSVVAIEIKREDHKLVFKFTVSSDTKRYVIYVKNSVNDPTVIEYITGKCFKN